MKYKLNQIKIIFITLTATVLAACSDGNFKIVPQPSGPNVVPLVVDSGFNHIHHYNVPYITITICQPGTNNCQTIDHVLVDTGSTGIKIISNQLNYELLSTLPVIQYQNKPVYECFHFGAGYTFGPGAIVDVKIGGESASNIPIQIIRSIPSKYVPDSCNEFSEADLTTSGAKAIIGINPISNPDNEYVNHSYIYNDDDNSYTEIEDQNDISTAMVVNPVSGFAVDNNGVIISIPNVAVAKQESLNGYLIFGLNTKANNKVSSSVVKVLGDPENYVATFLANTFSVANLYALFDSGTIKNSFYDTSINPCYGALIGLYCPSISPTNWISYIHSYNSDKLIQIVNPVINYMYNLTSITYNVVPGISGIRAPFGIVMYGLPSFYGHNIYLGFKGESSNITPLGVGPAWGYENN